MDKVALKQGTLQWEQARESRIGSSEVFDLVRYYASAEELQNCGISPEKIMEESPYSSAWALYHKMRGDGLYQRESLAPEYAQYGHAVEPYGLFVLQQGRKNRVKRGEVYVSDRLIASLDLSGISEDCDARPFDVGQGLVPVGKRFVCEQKSMTMERYQAGLPIKYIIQAQYQAAMVQADFFIIQIMMLHNDSAFERGRVTQMNLTQRRKYLAQNMTMEHLYFRYNDALAALIACCLDRFLAAVDKEEEPTPYIEQDSMANILASIRSNSYFDPKAAITFALSPYVDAKQRRDEAERERKKILQGILEEAKAHNVVKFWSEDGTKVSFSKDGKFLVRLPKEVPHAAF